MKKILLFSAFVLLFAACSEKHSEGLSTELFNYSEEVLGFLEPLKKTSDLASFDKEIVLVNTKEFSVTNKYILPFLHYQLLMNGVDTSIITKEMVDDFMYSYAYIFAQNALLEKEAIDKGFEVTDEEVNRQIEERAQGRLEEFKEFLKTTALTYEHYLKDIKQSLLIDKYESSVLEGLEVTEEEKKEYYLNNPTISLTEPELSLRSIRVNFNIGNDKEKALKKITKVREDILSGKDFADMAGKHSDDLSSKNAGGKLGDYIRRGDLEPKSEIVAFSTPAGEVSEIIELDNAYEIVKVESISSEGTIEYDDISETISRILNYLKKEKAISDDIKRIAEKYDLKYWKI